MKPIIFHLYAKSANVKWQRQTTLRIAIFKQLYPEKIDVSNDNTTIIAWQVSPGIEKSPTSSFGNSVEHIRKILIE
ncbi:MAG TPA: hypothetical protein VIV35_09420 [Chitinophagaceae bacterium]